MNENENAVEQQNEPEKVIVQITGIWGNEYNPPSDRGYFGQTVILTPEQINGKFKFAREQFIRTLQEMHMEANQEDTTNGRE